MQETRSKVPAIVRRQSTPLDVRAEADRFSMGLWSENASLKPKAWLIGSKWRAVIGKQIVSKRCFETKGAALKEAARQQSEECQ
jgi:hypothetical protein